MKFLFQPVSIASLIFFRIIFGILAFVDVLNTWVYYHLTVGAFNPERFQFRYYGFEWTKPIPEPWMSIFFIGLMLVALCIAFGYKYRLMSWVFAFGFSYTYFLEKAFYLNHGYLFCWICFVMALLPAHRALSVDVKLRPELKVSTIPFWCLFILPFMMGVVYFYGGIAKINPDWLQGVPLKIWLKNKADLFLIGPLIAKEGTAYFMSYGGLLLDLLAVFFLLNKRTRTWVFGFILFFHGMNHLVFNIGIFPFLSIALTALYFPPDFPEKIGLRLAKRWQWLQRFIARQPKPSVTPVPLWQEQATLRPVIAAGLGVIIAIHLLLPLRHHLFPGDVAWTEEGHRYSWRMMLRSKQGYGTFTIVDKTTGEKEKIQPRDHLQNKQHRKLYTHPDMILQFAHYLRDQKLAEGQEVEVYADIKVKLNGGEYQRFIDPGVDLAAVEWQFFRSAEWILHL